VEHTTGAGQVRETVRSGPWPQVHEDLGARDLGGLRRWSWRRWPRPPGSYAGPTSRSPPASGPTPRSGTLGTIGERLGPRRGRSTSTSTAVSARSRSAGCVAGSGTSSRTAALSSGVAAVRPSRAAPAPGPAPGGRGRRRARHPGGPTPRRPRPGGGGDATAGARPDPAGDTSQGMPTLCKLERQPVSRLSAATPQAASRRTTALRPTRPLSRADAVLSMAAEDRVKWRGWHGMQEVSWATPTLGSGGRVVAAGARSRLDEERRTG
jgi:hypothetical protein